MARTYDVVLENMDEKSKAETIIFSNIDLNDARKEERVFTKVNLYETMMFLSAIPRRLSNERQGTS